MNPRRRPHLSEVRAPAPTLALRGPQPSQGTLALSTGYGGSYVTRISTIDLEELERRQKAQEPLPGQLGLKEGA